MSQKRIMIVGAAGQLGFDLCHAMKEYYEIIAVDRGDCDVADRDVVSAVIQKARPDVVINLAAFHETEKCEREPERAFSVNALGAYYVAIAARAVGATVFFMSTDYAFDGSKDFFVETDTPRPLNIYGASKISGEHLTRIGNPEGWRIIRTSWMFGAHMAGKLNFPQMMLTRALRGEVLRVVDDQVGSPTYARDLAEKIKELIERDAPCGVYHITNAGSCSWYAFAKKIFELSGVIPKELIPIMTKESGTIIARPRVSVLKSARLQELGIAPLRHWHDALAAYLDEIKEK
ncbi:MAG: dTDP-4-dehydrorhamnose reductase [Candidatus Sungbacteria bacterium]|nr:dTDP-4-dehydrorhamnose reductase [Candidatus Sungbacteria bacterium]